LLSSDVTASLTIDGPTVPMTISTPGQAGTYTFNATAGQTINLAVSGTLPNYAYLSVTQPNGSSVAYIEYGGSGNFSSSLTNLPVTGTYLIRVEPGNNATGGISIGLTD